MIPNLDYLISQHDQTVRRSEANYALIGASATKTSNVSQQRPRRTIWELLRRLAGPAAA